MGRQLRTWLVAACAAVLVVPLAGSGSTAQTAAATSGKPPTPAARAAEPRKCTLRPSAHAPRDEWASCLSVSATLDKAPGVGETATLSFTVTGQYATDGVLMQADLPANLTWDVVPPGMTYATQRAATPESGGWIHRASKVQSLQAGQRMAYTGTVRATAPGQAQILVRAEAPALGGTDAGEDTVLVTIGDKSAASKLGPPATRSTAVTKVADGVAPQPATPHLPHRSVEPAAPAAKTGTKQSEPTAAQPALASLAAPTTCAVGRWQYVDNNGVTRPSRNFGVEAHDHDPNTRHGDQVIATGVTDANGRYRLCFDNTDAEGGGQDLYVMFKSDNSRWRVNGTDGFYYSYFSNTVDNVTTGSTTDFGSLQPSDNTQMPALHAFDEANDLWNWHPASNGCWDPLDGSGCRQIRIQWTPGSTDGNRYEPDENQVHLKATAPNFPHTVVHELTHGVMDDVYEDNLPDTPNCIPHSVTGASSARCAWVEGFADWTPLAVYNVTSLRLSTGTTELETPTWNTSGWGSGETVEGRVAGTLLDIADSANESVWDRCAEGDPGKIWTTFVNRRAPTFLGFWVNRQADGFDVSDAGTKACLWQNTIDDNVNYLFREPLRDYAELLRPDPNPPHNYGYNTTTNFWSVVAIRPSTAVDSDLELYGDRAQTSGGLLGTSALGGNVIDFIAVDSNNGRFPLGDYYPRAKLFTGSGNYRIELAQGSSVINPGESQNIAMNFSDVVAVRDAFLTAGTPVTFTVTVNVNDHDPELFLVGSPSSGNKAQPRASALASSSNAGGGGQEQLIFTPATSGWYGVVVTNKGGSGPFTLHRS